MATPSRFASLRASTPRSSNGSAPTAPRCTGSRGRRAFRAPSRTHAIAPPRPARSCSGSSRSEQNVLAHYEGTAAEILDLVPQVDAFIAGVGTGGTITGVGRRLKERNPQCRIVAVEPRLGVHVQGLKSMSDGWIPPILDDSLLDGRIIVGSRHAVRHAKQLMREQGLAVGISSGAVMHAGMRVASRLGGSGNIVLMFADGAAKYVATELWAAPEAEDNSELEDPLDDVLWW